MHIGSTGPIANTPLVSTFWSPVVVPTRPHVLRSPTRQRKLWASTSASRRWITSNILKTSTAWTTSNCICSRSKRCQHWASTSIWLYGSLASRFSGDGPNPTGLNEQFALTEG